MQAELATQFKILASLVNDFAAASGIPRDAAF
jgi:hypothetical protein